MLHDDKVWHHRGVNFEKGGMYFVDTTSVLLLGSSRNGKSVYPIPLLFCSKRTYSDAL